MEFVIELNDLSAMETIHIRNIGCQWYVKADNWRLPNIAYPNKNAAVQKGISIGKVLFSKVKLIIHALDGRVLEERLIETAPLNSQHKLKIN